MNLKCMRMVVLGTAAAVSPYLMSAQGGASSQGGNQTGGQQTGGQQSGQQQPGGAAGSGMAGAMTGSGGSNDMQSMKDKTFLRKAAAGGMAEIQLGQLASEKGGSQAVKDFGQKMVTDHTTLNDSMKPICESMGVMAPKKLNKKDQAEYDKLNGLSGDAFDKEYVAYMLKDHHMDLREFRAESASAQDPALKAAVEKGQQVIQEHLQMVEKMAKDKGVGTSGSAGE